MNSHESSNGATHLATLLRLAEEAYLGKPDPAMDGEPGQPGMPLKRAGGIEHRVSTHANDVPWVQKENLERVRILFLDGKKSIPRIIRTYFTHHASEGNLSTREQVNDLRGKVKAAIRHVVAMDGKKSSVLTRAINVGVRPIYDFLDSLRLPSEAQLVARRKQQEQNEARKGGPKAAGDTPAVAASTGDHARINRTATVPAGTDDTSSAAVHSPALNPSANGSGAPPPSSPPPAGGSPPSGIAPAPPAAPAAPAAALPPASSVNGSDTVRAPEPPRTPEERWRENTVERRYLLENAARGTFDAVMNELSKDLRAGIQPLLGRNEEITDTDFTLIDCAMKAALNAIHRIGNFAKKPEAAGLPAAKARLTSILSSELKSVRTKMADCRKEAAQGARSHPPNATLDDWLTRLESKMHEAIDGWTLESIETLALESSSEPLDAGSILMPKTTAFLTNRQGRPALCWELTPLEHARLRNVLRQKDCASGGRPAEAAALLNGTTRGGRTDVHGQCVILPGDVRSAAEAHASIDALARNVSRALTRHVLESWLPALREHLMRQGGIARVGTGAGTVLLPGKDTFCMEWLGVLERTIGEWIETRLNIGPATPSGRLDRLYAVVVEQGEATRRTLAGVAKERIRTLPAGELLAPSAQGLSLQGIDGAALERMIMEGNSGEEEAGWDALVRATLLVGRDDEAAFPLLPEEEELAKTEMRKFLQSAMPRGRTYDEILEALSGSGGPVEKIAQQCNDRWHGGLAFRSASAEGMVAPAVLAALDEYSIASEEPSRAEREYAVTFVQSGEAGHKLLQHELNTYLHGEDFQRSSRFAKDLLAWAMEKVSPDQREKKSKSAAGVPVPVSDEQRQTAGAPLPQRTDVSDGTGVATSEAPAEADDTAALPALGAPPATDATEAPAAAEQVLTDRDWPMIFSRLSDPRLYFDVLGKKRGQECADAMAALVNTTCDTYIGAACTPEERRKVELIVRACAEHAFCPRHLEFALHRLRPAAWLTSTVRNHLYAGADAPGLAFGLSNLISVRHSMNKVVSPAVYLRFRARGASIDLPPMSGEAAGVSIGLPLTDLEKEVLRLRTQALRSDLSHPVRRQRAIHGLLDEINEPRLRSKLPILLEQDMEEYVAGLEREAAAKAGTAAPTQTFSHPLPDTTARPPVLGGNYLTEMARSAQEFAQRNQSLPAPEAQPERTVMSKEMLIAQIEKEIESYLRDDRTQEKRQETVSRFTHYVLSRHLLHRDLEGIIPALYLCVGEKHVLKTACLPNGQYLSRARANGATVTANEFIARYIEPEVYLGLVQKRHALRELIAGLILEWDATSAVPDLATYIDQRLEQLCRKELMDDTDQTVTIRGPAAPGMTVLPAPAVRTTPPPDARSVTSPAAETEAELRGLFSKEATFLEHWLRTRDLSSMSTQDPASTMRPVVVFQMKRHVYGGKPPYNWKQLHDLAVEYFIEARDTGLVPDFSDFVERRMRAAAAGGASDPVPTASAPRVAPKHTRIDRPEPTVPRPVASRLAPPAAAPPPAPEAALPPAAGSDGSSVARPVEHGEEALMEFWRDSQRKLIEEIFRSAPSAQKKQELDRRLDEVTMDLHTAKAALGAAVKALGARHDNVIDQTMGACDDLTFATFDATVKPQRDFLALLKKHDDALQEIARCQTACTTLLGEINDVLEGYDRAHRYLTHDLQTLTAGMPVGEFLHKVLKLDTILPSLTVSSKAEFQQLKWDVHKVCNEESEPSPDQEFLSKEQRENLKQAIRDKIRDMLEQCKKDIDELTK
ncbi:MAG: translation initiation factor IF-2 [Candidatus Peregrinibacteria bacterium Greene0416_19]|nr:MAG: translation initiation factor IF-2 [Candidatus Peregrinibacteria bacterium Greene0416_19]